MAKWKKLFTKVLIGGFIVVLLFIGINAFKVDLKPEVQELLQVSTDINPDDDKVCAAVLGLSVSESLNSQQEGLRLLGLLQVKFGDPDSLAKAAAVEIPNILRRIPLDRYCQNVCVYTEEEKTKYRKLLDQQRVYLDRFKSLVQGEGLLCRHPFSMMKFPLTSFFAVVDNQIVEYVLLGQMGEVEKARQGLLQINQFIEKTLLREKSTITTSHIALAFLKRVREAYRTFEKDQPSERVTFTPIQFDEIAEKTMIGELQIYQWILSFPGPLDYFYMSDMAQAARGSTQNPLDKIMYYFFSPNETMNDIFSSITSARWDPCLAQTDIQCKDNSPNPLTWVRNPVGKILFLVLSPQWHDGYRLLKTRIDEVNKI